VVSGNAVVDLTFIRRTIPRLDITMLRSYYLINEHVHFYRRMRWRGLQKGC
jgi:hypothetical protein